MRPPLLPSNTNLELLHLESAGYTLQGASTYACMHACVHAEVLQLPGRPACMLASGTTSGRRSMQGSSCVVRGDPVKAYGFRREPLNC